VMAAIATAIMMLIRIMRGGLSEESGTIPGVTQMFDAPGYRCRLPMHATRDCSIFCEELHFA
jgi:hypothetical protein